MLRDRARSQVQENFDTYTKGDVLVEQGQAIGEEQLILLRMEHEAAVRSLTLGEKARRAVGAPRPGGRRCSSSAATTSAGTSGRSPATCRGSRPSAAWLSLRWPLVRLLANQPWNAELVPVASCAMILAIAYNPHFALDGHVLPLAADLHRAGDRDLPLPGDHGGDRGRRAGAQRGANPDEADQGRRHGGVTLLGADLGHGSLGAPADRA